MLGAGAAGELRAHPYEPLQCATLATVTETVSYEVPGTSLVREIDVEIEEPTGLPAGTAAPLPTVVWSHGGASGGTTAKMAEWRTTAAAACYVSVTIGHAWPAADLEQALCEDLLELDAGIDCGDDLYKLLDLLRPFDIAAVLDHLEANHAALVDGARIAVGGHSSGSAAALMVAGATRGYLTGDASEDFIDVRDLSDPRPAAFLAFSPHGPGVAGFYESSKQGPETSWDGVTRPVLLATGDGDNGCDAAGTPDVSSSVYYCSEGTTPANRSAVFDLLPSDPGGETTKYRLYIDDWRARHSVFNLKRSTCVSGGGTTRDDLCDMMVDALSSAAVAFLDWHLRGDPDAEYFLTLDAGVPGSRGKFAWSRK